MDVHLLSHANAKYWDFASEMTYNFATYTCIGLGMARSWTEYKLRWFQCYQFLKSDLVVTKDCDRCSLKNKILVDIPGEGVIIVNEY